MGFSAQIEVSVNDSGTPQGRVTVRSWLDIQTVNDVTPVVTVTVDGDCLVYPTVDGSAATLYTVNEEMRKRREAMPQKSMAKRDVRSFG